MKSMVHVLVILSFLTNRLRAIQPDLCNCKRLENDQARQDHTLVDRKDLRSVAAIFQTSKAIHRSFRNGEKLKKFQYAFICGGSLLNSRFVLTAARCLDSKLSENSSDSHYEPIRYVGIGLNHDLKEIFSSSDHCKKVKEIYQFPDYDVGLVETEESFELGSKFNIYPACVMHDRIPFYDGWLVSTSWIGEGSQDVIASALTLDSDRSVRLHYATLKMKKCDLKKLICAKSESETYRYAYSGEPVYWSDEGRLYLVGVTAYQVKSKLIGLEEEARILDIYHFKDWMHQIIKNDLCLIKSERSSNIRIADEESPFKGFRAFFLVTTILGIVFLLIFLTAYRIQDITKHDEQVSSPEDFESSSLAKD